MSKKKVAIQTLKNFRGRTNPVRYCWHHFPAKFGNDV